MQIFFFRSKSAPDMTFLLVHIQNLSNLYGKRWIDHFETFSTVFMYRTLTYPELLRRLTHGSTILYYVTGNFYDTLFNIIFQRKIPRKRCFYSVCGGFLQAFLNFLI